MNTPFDPETSAVEQMLHDRTPHSPPPALRTRVLAAVDDVLRDDWPMKRAEPADRFQWLPVGVLLATALSLLIAVAVSWDPAAHSVGAATDRPLLSFAQRAEAAGIALELDPPAADRLASVQPIDTSSPRHGHILHSLDTRSFLQGDL